VRRETKALIGATLALLSIGVVVGLRAAAAGPAPEVRHHSPERAAAAANAQRPALPSAAPQPAPSAFVESERIRETPDLTQTDAELSLPAGGDSYCAPVAASNALVFLGEHGFNKLLPEGATRRERQLELVRRLAAGRYMATSDEHGTGARGVLLGLHRYFEHTGHAYRSLRYQGWRAHDPRFATGVRVPELSFIRRGLEEHGFALINVGWYRKAPDRRLYLRNGGHWLTVVGAGLDEQGRPAPELLALKDPAPYAGAGPKTEYVRLEPLDGGWMFELETSLPAKGYFRVSGGMHIKRDGEMAILDGAIVGEL